MSIEVPAAIVAERDGTVVAQNAPARKLMGPGAGRKCWNLIGDLKNTVGLPCRSECVRGLLDSGMEHAQHTRPEIAGQRHHLTCIPLAVNTRAALVAAGFRLGYLG